MNQIDTYDAIVVGARIAGSATAHQLALRGWRVALVERKTPPLGLALSVPITYQRGLARFRDLGLLPVIEEIMPRLAPIYTIRMRYDAELVLGGRVPPFAGFDCSVILRREVLDDALLTHVLDGRYPGSVTLYPGCRVDELLYAAGGQVEGVHLESRAQSDRGSAVRELRAPLVIGADGRLSHMAYLLGDQAAPYNQRVSTTTLCYSYCTGADMDGLADVTFTASQDHRMVMMGAAGENLQVIAVFIPVSQYAAFRQDPQGELTRSWQGAPELAGRMDRVALVGKVLGLDPKYGGGYFRPVGGPGWALVGDAGHFKDPASGQGIHDALYTVQQLLAAIDAATGGTPLTASAAGDAWTSAVRHMQQRRDTELQPMYAFTYRFSELLSRTPTRLEYALLRSVAEDPILMSAFLGISTGATTFEAFRRELLPALRRRLRRHPLDAFRLFRRPRTLAPSPRVAQAVIAR